jgi:hypothetical protein
MRTSSIGVFLAASAIIALTSGCASITGTTNQSVSVQTLEEGGRELSGAVCELSNNKGKWFITTPGSTVITRSNDDMQVLCNKAGLEPGRASVVSATKGSMWGNIVFGGGIGAIVDHNSGAAYEYPTFFQVKMGMTTRIEPDPASQPQPSAPEPSAASQAQAPAPTPAPALLPTSTTQPTTLKSSVDERLRELKRLRESGLIDESVYLERQRKILESQQ